MPNISIARFNELEAKEQRLQEIQQSLLLKPFAEALITAVGTVLAHTPWVCWPEFAKVCFRNCAQKMPTAAKLYKDNLPKQ